MTRRNRLQEILKDLGFESFRPSEALLARFNMTYRRFMRILRNEGKKEMTVPEKEKIENWLSSLMNKPLSEINLMDDEPRGSVLKRHKLS